MIQKQWATAGGKAAALLFPGQRMNHTGLRVMPNTNVLGGLLIQTSAHELQRETLKSLQQNTLKARDNLYGIWNLNKKSTEFKQASLEALNANHLKFFTPPPDTRTKRIMNSRCSRGSVPLLPLLVVLLCVEFDLLVKRKNRHVSC